MEPISNFKGTFQRGRADATPEDHFLNSQNIYFPFGGCDTRKGTELDINLSAIRRMVLYKRINESPRLLILVDGGLLYDSTSLSAPILTIAAMTDFSAAFFYNRAYISPHNGTKGLPGETVRVYDGTTVRVAAGGQPTGTMLAANSASSGKIDVGVHLVALVIESPSGHLSKPGPIVFAQFTATGDKKADISGIPLGASGTPRRRFIATRAISNYDGNQFGQEFFFVPNGVIENNTATTFTIDFYDSELQDTADYLFDIRTSIPAGLVIGSFEGRMLVGNLDEDQNLLLVSKTNEPEQFDAADDLIVVDPTEAGGVTAAVEHHGLLVIMKSFRSYSTTDNGQEPSTWRVQPFDKAIGTEVHGVATILDATGTSIDRFLMASRPGLIMYSGTFQEPELTYKIKNIWDRINDSYFHTIEVALDPLNKRIYIAAPLDASTTPDYLLYGDYSDGLSFENIKWTVWKFPYKPTTIVVDLVNKVPILKIGSHDNGVFKQVDSTLSDNLVAIDTFLEFALIPQSHSGVINHYNWFRVNMKGAGNVQVTVHGQEDSLPKTYASFALNANGQDKLRKINFEGERCSVKLRLSNINEYFQLNSFLLNFTQRWNYRVG